MLIIEREKTLLVTEADKKAFFEAIIDPPKPNKALVQASREYLKLVEAK